MGWGKAYRTTMSFIAALLLASCAVGPDFVPAASSGRAMAIRRSRWAKAQHRPPRRAGEAQRFVRDLDLPGQWWTLFHSKALNSLVEKALAANPDLQAAQAALRVAQGERLCAAGLPVAQRRRQLQRHSAEVRRSAFRPMSTLPAPTFNLFTGQLNISYSPDVFGGTRRSIEALAAQADLQRFQLEATYLTLTSNLAGAAVQEASLRGQIAATLSIIKIETDVLDLLRRQRELGQVAEADVVAQEAALAQVEQTLPPLQKQLAQQRDLLAALSGGFPSERLPQRFVLAALRLPRDLPVSLPSKLVEQRPDVRAAEANLHCRQRPDRRRHRQPAAQHHALGARAAAPRSRSINCSRRAPASGTRPAASRSRSSTAARCCTASSPRRRPTTRRRRSIAAR